MIITLCRRGLLKVYASFCELNISFYKTLTFRFVHYIRDVSDCLSIFCFQSFPMFARLESILIPLISRKLYICVYMSA